MSDKNQASEDWKKIVEDAQNLFGSISAGIKNAIKHYQKKAEDKSAEKEKPAAQTPPPPPPIPPAATHVEKASNETVIPPVVNEPTQVKPEDTDKDSANK